MKRPKICSLLITLVALTMMVVFISCDDNPEFLGNGDILFKLETDEDKIQDDETYYVFLGINTTDKTFFYSSLLPKDEVSFLNLPEKERPFKENFLLADGGPGIYRYELSVLNAGDWEVSVYEVENFVGPTSEDDGDIEQTYNAIKTALTDLPSSIKVLRKFQGHTFTLESGEEHTVEVVWTIVDSGSDGNDD